MALERNTSLSELAGYGFINLEPALKNLEELVELLGDRVRPALAFVAKAQNPDQSLELLLQLSRNHTSQLKSFGAKASHLERLCNSNPSEQRLTTSKDSVWFSVHQVRCLSS